MFFFYSSLKYIYVKNSLSLIRSEDNMRAFDGLNSSDRQLMTTFSLYANSDYYYVNVFQEKSMNQMYE